MYKPNSYFVQSPLWPLRKSHRRSLLTFCKRMAGCGVCIFPCLHVCSHISDFVLLMCMHNEIGSGWRGTPRKRERWRDRNKKKWSTLINQVKVQPVAGATAIFFFHYHVSRHLTLPSSPLLISSTSTSAGGGGREGCCPLCQMRSVDISHQTGADQRPACAHAGRRIKPHHAQPPWQKKASPHE